jgi:PAS domain S-box-containing protein
MMSESKTSAVHKTLRASEQQFQLLVQGVKDYAIFMLDPQGRITTWNSGAERIKGYRAEEIIGEHFSRFYTQEDQRYGQYGSPYLPESPNNPHGNGMRFYR